MTANLVTDRETIPSSLEGIGFFEVATNDGWEGAIGFREGM